MNNLKQDAKSFRSTFNHAVSKSTIRKTTPEKDAKALVQRFQNQTEGMLKQFQSSKKVDTPLPVVVQVPGGPRKSRVRLPGDRRLIRPGRRSGRNSTQFRELLILRPLARCIVIARYCAAGERYNSFPLGVFCGLTPTGNVLAPAYSTIDRLFKEERRETAATKKATQDTPKAVTSDDSKKQ